MSTDRDKQGSSVAASEHQKLDLGRRAFKFSDFASAAPAGTSRKLPPAPGKIPVAKQAPPIAEILNKTKP